MMKKIVVFALIAFSLKGFSQDASVEKSIYGIQTGLLGVWANNESKLANKFSLRSEIGIEMGFATYYSNGNKKTTIVGVPTISVEPKWYYNLNKRNAKGKNINKNSGNFFSIKTLYVPDFFLITNIDNLNVVDQIAIIPKWGIRRVYGQHFTFETGFGLGPIIYLDNTDKTIEKNDIYPDLHLRIGYTF